MSDVNKSEDTNQSVVQKYREYHFISVYNAMILYIGSMINFMDKMLKPKMKVHVSPWFLKDDDYKILCIVWLRQ